MTARWMIAALLILAALCLAIPAGAAQFQEMTAFPVPNAFGVGWGDYDGDGYPDLFVGGFNQGTEFPQHGPVLYRNQHDLTFADVSEALGFSADFIEQDGVSWGDYDNDGDLDLLVGSGAGYPMLYRRDADSFVEFGQEAGFHVSFSAGRGTAWCDYDGDNLLDAFCSNIFGPGYLMRNNGNGTFTEMSATAGMTGAASNESAQSASWGDYNNDGWPDLVLARLAQSTTLFRNNGDGTFTDVSASSGMSAYIDAYSAVWGDYDNDGWLDCYVTSGNYTEPQLQPDALFHSNRDGTFTDVAATVGMATDHANGVGAAWADYDNDGHLDIFVSNLGQNAFLYHNNGNGTFSNVAAMSGAGGSSYANAVAWADIDLDGRLDLLEAVYDESSRLFHNIGPSGNWLRVRALTSGTGDATGDDPVRDAIGARVEVNLDNNDSFPSGRTLIREIDGGSGFCGQNEQIAQFGLGSATLVAVRVQSPDGSVVVHRGVVANQQITIRDVPADREEIFDDVPLDYWAYEPTRGCVDADIVSGFPDGTYQPSASVTRAQMAVFLVRALGQEPTGPVTPQSWKDAYGYDPAVPSTWAVDFTDVPASGWGDPEGPYWAWFHIQRLYEVGVTQGVTATEYGPAREVLRDQMAVFLIRALGGECANPCVDTTCWPYDPANPATWAHDFADIPATGQATCHGAHWAWFHIQALYETGVTLGCGDGTNYCPAASVRRDEMAAFLARAFLGM